VRCVARGGVIVTRAEQGLPPLNIQVVSEGGHCVPCMIAIDATREVAAEFSEGEVAVEVVTLKEPAGAERYRELRRSAGRHLPVPCVLLEGHLVSPGIPEPDEFRDVIQEALLHGVPEPDDTTLATVDERLGVAE
jgi:hypothetical protein